MKFLTLPRAVIAFICLICLVGTLLPIFHSTFFLPHDFTHVTRIAEMFRSLTAGEFPVRWSRNFGFGYGMPLFNFYAPLPYYLAVIPYALGVGGVNSVKFLYVLNAILAFVGMYFLAREVWGRKAGLLSALVFSVVTYRALDLYVRGAVGEVYGMVILPFCFWGIVRISKNREHGWLILALSLAALLLSHNLIGMVGCVFIAVFALFWLMVAAKSVKDYLIKLAKVIGACLIGGLLSAFYTLPGFLEKSYTRVEQTITTGYFDYHYHLLLVRQLFLGKWGYGGSAPYPYGGLSFVLGIFTLSLVGLALLAILIKGKRRERLYGLIVLVLAMLSTFMTLNKSVYIWDHVAILKYLQFPWRFLTFTDVFLSLLAGGAVYITRLKKELFLVPVVLVIGLLVRQVPLFTPEKYLTNGQQVAEYYEDPARIRSTMSKTLNDYLPPSVKDNALPSPVNDRLAPTLPGSKFEMIKDSPVDFKARVYCPENCNFTVNVYQFPEWKAWVDNSSVPLNKAPHMPIYTMAVPAGTHQLHVYLGNTLVRVVGNLLSLVTLLGLVTGVGIWQFRKERQQ